MTPVHWALGRQGQLYLVEESAYDTVTTQLATTALRHLNFTAHYDPKSLDKSIERHASHPSQLVMQTRRAKATWGVKSQLYPSGALNTLPEATALLKNGFGAAPSNITLSTTVASGAGVSGATVASATGLVVGQAIQIGVLGGAAPGVYIRFLTGISTLALTWAPALPATCAVSDTVKGCVTYGLGSTIPKSLDLCHYPQSPSAWYNREVLGAIIEKLALTFDSNLEPQLDVSGPASEMVTAPAQPGGFTTVGAENGIPSGLTGSFLWGNVAYQMEKLTVDIANAMELQNTAFGTAKATDFYRKGKRAVTLKVDAKVSDDLTMWTPSLTPSAGTLFLQCGLTSGKIWALYVPIAQLMNPPDAPDGDETNQFSFAITALGNAGNDEVFLAQA